MEELELNFICTLLPELTSRWTTDRTRLHLSTKIYILAFSPPVTESKRNYQRIHDKTKDGDTIA